MCFTMEDAKHVVETIDALLTGMYALVLKGILFVHFQMTHWKHQPP